MNRLKLLFPLAALAVAVVLLIRFFGRDDGVSERAFFYDESAKKLFAAPRTGVPPIRGIDGDLEDAVRAVVISTNGRPEDKRTHRIAYLERYSPELKRQMEAAQASGSSPPMGRAEAQRHRFVRRPADPEWVPMSTPEGEAILTEWAVPGPDGASPVVCSP